jgi:MFS family permease
MGGNRLPFDHFEFIPVFGRVADLLGRKKVFSLGFLILPLDQSFAAWPQYLVSGRDPGVAGNWRFHVNVK